MPVIVDAGVGTASDAAIAMELGADGVLMNTAIALADDPVAMATAMKLAVEAGRLAFRAGRIPRAPTRRRAAPSRGMIAARAAARGANGRGCASDRREIEQTLDALTPEGERDEADRRYNEALTALDRALQPPPPSAPAAAGLDDAQITPLNEAWNIILPPPPAGRRLARAARAASSGARSRRILQRQLTFNSRARRSPQSQRGGAARGARASARGRRAARAGRGAARVPVAADRLLQQITAYVDTKDPTRRAARSC